MMNILPVTITTPPSAAAPESGSESSEGFLAVLADALTALHDELSDAAAELGDPDEDHEVDLLVDEIVLLVADEVPAWQRTAADASELDEDLMSVEELVAAIVSGGEVESADGEPTTAGEQGPTAVEPAPTDPSTPSRLDADAAAVTAEVPTAPVTGPVGAVYSTSETVAPEPPPITPGIEPSRSAAEPDPAPPAPTAPATETGPTAPTASMPTMPTMPVAEAQATDASGETTDVSSLTMEVDDDPWQQVARVIRPLRQLPDGSHRISLQLRPAELGTVHLEVALEDGRLSMRAVADTLAARDALAAAMPDLRAELTRSGIDLGSLDVGADTTDGEGGSGDAPAGGGPARAHLTAAAGSTGPVPSPSTAPTPSAAGSGRLDVTL